ncbi:hypothetical protein REPUB_Repub01dG0047600 [Reevesia pubescens]
MNGSFNAQTWEGIFSRPLLDREKALLMSLFNALSGVVLVLDKMDKISWELDPKGVFSVKKVSLLLNQFSNSNLVKEGAGVEGYAWWNGPAWCCLHGTIRKLRPYVDWVPPVLGLLKFNMDTAAKR